MINIIGNFFGIDGYASHTRNLANALDNVTDVRVTCNLPNGWNENISDKELLMIKRQSIDNEINLMSLLNTRTLKQIITQYTATRSLLLAKEYKIFDIHTKEYSIDLFMALTFLLWCEAGEEGKLDEKSYFIQQIRLFQDTKEHLESFSLFIVSSIENMFHSMHLTNYFSQEDFASLKQLNLPISCFYNESIDYKKGIKSPLPLFNLYQYLDSEFNAINHYTLGTIYEFVISQDTKRNYGIYYMSPLGYPA